MKMLIVTIVLLVLVRLALWAFFAYVSKFTTPKPAAAHPAPAAPAAGHGAGGHAGGHDDHSKKDHWWPHRLVLLIGMVGFLAVLWMRGAGFFVIPSLRTQGHSVQYTSRSYTPPIVRSPQWEWAFVDLPPVTGDWLVVKNVAGLTIEYCGVKTDPNCTATKPEGYLVACIDAQGYEQTGADRCDTIGHAMKFKSATSKPFRLKYRDIQP